jgi:hypothetical protein
LRDSDQKIDRSPNSVKDRLPVLPWRAAHRHGCGIRYWNRGATRSGFSRRSLADWRTFQGGGTCTRWGSPHHEIRSGVEGVQVRSANLTGLTSRPQVALKADYPPSR